MSFLNIFFTKAEADDPAFDRRYDKFISKEDMELFGRLYGEFWQPLLGGPRYYTVTAAHTDAKETQSFVTEKLKLESLDYMKALISLNNAVQILESSLTLNSFETSEVQQNLDRVMALAEAFHGVCRKQQDKHKLDLGRVQAVHDSLRDMRERHPELAKDKRVLDLISALDTHYRQIKQARVELAKAETAQKEMKEEKPFVVTYPEALASLQAAVDTLESSLHDSITPGSFFGFFASSMEKSLSHVLTEAKVFYTAAEQQQNQHELDGTVIYTLAEYLKKICYRREDLFRNKGLGKLISYLHNHSLGIKEEQAKFAESLENARTVTVGMVKRQG